MKLEVLLGVLALAGLGLGLHAWGTARKVELWHALAGGVEVSARVTNRRMVKVSTHAARTGYDIEYRDHTGTVRTLQSVLAERTLEIGNEVTLRFDPEDPTRIALAPALTKVSQRDRAVIATLFVGLGLGLAFAA